MFKVAYGNDITETATYFASTKCLNLNLLTTTIVAPPSNASKWQMGFNSAFKGLKIGKMLGNEG